MFSLGSDPDLTGFYKQRQDPITKCADVARSRGYQLFAIQNGGMCLSGLKVQETYKIHGLARNCKDGKGGEWANDVYIFNGETCLSSYNTKRSQLVAHVLNLRLLTDLYKL